MKQKSSLAVSCSIISVALILVAVLVLIVDIERQRRVNEIAVYRQFFLLETERLAGRLKDITGLNEILIHDPVILTSLLRIGQGQEPSRAAVGMVKTILTNISTIDHVLAVFLLDGRGTCVFSSRPDFIGANYGFRPYFTSALQQGRGTYVARGVTSHQLGIYFSRLIRSGDRVLGVSVLKLEPAFFDRTPLFFITGNKPSDKEVLRVGLVTGQGLFVDVATGSVHTLGPLDRQVAEGIRQVRQVPVDDIRPLPFAAGTWTLLRRSGFLARPAAGEDYYLFAAPLGATNLHFLHVVKKSWLHQTYRQNLGLYNGLLLVFACLLVLVCLQIFFLDRRHRIVLQQSAALAESEGKLRLFSRAVEQSGNSMVITDREGRIIYVNPAFCDATGFSRDEVLGENPRLLKSGIQEEAVYTDLWQTISSGRTWKGTFCNRKKNGELFWEEATISPIFNEDNEISHYIAVKEDITERRAISRRLEEESDKLQFVVEYAGFGIAIVVDRCFAWVNRSGLEMFGFASPDEVIGRSTAMVYADPELHQRVGQWFLDPANQGRICKMEMRLRKKDGSIFWAALNGKALDSREPGRGVIWIVEDITRRKQYEEELLQAQKDAEAASEMKSRLLTNISHDIRTPLHGIMGTFDLLQDMGLGPEQERLVDSGRQAAHFLLNLLNNLLDLSKIEAGQLVLDAFPFAIRELIREVGEMLSSQFRRKGVRFCSAVADDVPAVLVADAIRIKQIFLNLAGNSIKFTDHGEVTVSVAVDGWQEEQVRLLCTVRDTGEGIPRSQQDRLFDAFTQADVSRTRRSVGTGLGLSICRELCALMGGRIWFESTPGKGTTFHFTLTCGIASGQQEKDPGTAEPIATWNGPSLAVLIVDDNEANQDILRIILEQDRHRVQVADNGLAALERLAEARFDLVFMDMQMPVMDGLTATRALRCCEAEACSLPPELAKEHGELIQRLRRMVQGGRVPVVALTANAMQDDREQCREAGMDAYLAKPFLRDQLLHVLADLFGPEGGEQQAAEPRAEEEQHEQAEPAEPGEQKEEQPLSPPTMESVRRCLRSRYPFTEEQLTTLVTATCSGIDRDLARLAGAVEARDPGRIREIAHRVKGSLLNLGLDELVSGVGAMEQAAKQGQDRDYGADMGRVWRQWRLFLRQAELEDDPAGGVHGQE